MIDPNATRVQLEAMLSNTGGLAELSDLADLGTVHSVVLEMTLDLKRRLRRDGYSAEDIAVALDVDVMLHRHERAATLRPPG